MPLSLSVNQVGEGRWEMINPHMVENLNVCKEMILSKGFEFTKYLIHPENLKYQLQLLAGFQYASHRKDVLRYFQLVLPPRFKEFFWLMTHKIFLSENLFLNTYCNLKEFSSVFPVLKNYIGEVSLQIVDYQKLQQLTQQEKRIVGLINMGMTNKEISDELFISTHTVRTHRNRIWRKLDIRHARELQKFQWLLS